MTFWWLSFCDTDAPKGQKFIGVAVVEGIDLPSAIKAAWASGCNPGGQVMGHPLPDDARHPPEDVLGKLFRGKDGAETLSSMCFGDSEVATLDEMVDRGVLVESAPGVYESADDGGQQK